MAALGVLSLLLLLITRTVVAGAHFLHEEERKWLLRALREEERHAGQELLAGAAAGDVRRLEAALRASCHAEDFEGKVLGQCADINVVDEDGRTPLLITAINGNVGAVRALLGDTRTDVNKQGGNSIEFENGPSSFRRLLSAMDLFGIPIVAEHFD